MPISSRFSVKAPECSVQQWILGQPNSEMPSTKAWIDADNPDRFVTLSEARLLAKRIAVGLQRHGLRPGQRVLIFSENSIYFPVLVYAIWMSGCIFTGANPGYTARELAYQLKDSEASVIISTARSAPVALEAAKSVNFDANNIFLLDATTVTPDSEFKQISPSGSPRSWTSLIASRAEGDAFSWVEPSNPRETICTLNYSSGTTGLPKGVEITHYNIVANSISLEDMDSNDPKDDSNLPDPRGLCFLPMYHAFCQQFYMCNYPRAQVPIYVMAGFDFVKFLTHIAKYRITSVLGVPPILNLVVKHPLAQKADLSSLRSFGCGAAPLSQETQTSLLERLPPGATCSQGWGMSELTCSAIIWDPRRRTKSSSCGELCADNHARLFDVETGKEVTEPNTPGELYISSETLMRGYWRNEKATKEAITVDEQGRRWLRTGDVFIVDKYGPGALFTVVDRAKELIKVKGNQVAPAELDALLLQRPDIADAAVIGVTIDSEEYPRAYVVRAEGTKATEKEIQDWVAGKVVRYKQLKGGVVFVDAIPKNPSGKVLRKVLREAAKAESSTKSKL